MSDNYPMYYSYYNRPLRLEMASDGRVEGFILNPSSGNFERAEFGIVAKAESVVTHPEVWPMERDEFIMDTEWTRANRIKGTDPVFDLYAVAVDLDESVRAQRRIWTEEERKFIRSILFLTYSMWEQRAEFVDPAPLPDH